MSKITLVLLITICLVLVYGNIVRRLRNTDRFKEFSKERELKISNQDDSQQIADEDKMRYRSKKPSDQTILALACRPPPITYIQAAIRSVEKRVPGDVVSAPLMEFPWHVAIMVQVGQKYEFHCGGVLLSPRHLLTAAHCITECKFIGSILQPNTCTPGNSGTFSKWKCAPPLKYKVIYGNDLSTSLPSRFRFVTEHFVNTAFTKMKTTDTNSGPYLNDLVAMYWPVPFPADSWCELEKVQGLANYDQNCYGLGHGFAGTPNNSPPLRKVSVMEDPSCQFVRERHPRLLCFTSVSNEVPSCRGDSGSPVVCKATSSSPYLVAGLFSSNSVDNASGNGGNNCSFSNSHSVLARLGATYSNHPSTAAIRDGVTASGISFVHVVQKSINYLDDRGRVDDFRCNL